MDAWEMIALIAIAMLIAAMTNAYFRVRDYLPRRCSCGQVVIDESPEQLAHEFVHGSKTCFPALERIK